MYLRKEIIVLLSIILLLEACSSSKKSKYKRLRGTWQESTVVIDGNNKDWPSPYPEYDDKAVNGSSLYFPSALQLAASDRFEGSFTKSDINNLSWVDYITKEKPELKRVTKKGK